MDDEDIFKKLHEIDEEDDEVKDIRFLKKDEINEFCEFCDAPARYVCFHCESFICYKHRRRLISKNGYDPDRSLFATPKVDVCFECFRDKIKWRRFIVGVICLIPLLFIFIGIWKIFPDYFIQSLLIMIPLLFVIISILYYSSR